MAIQLVDFSVEATGNQRSTLPLGKKVAFTGKRWGVVLPENGEYTWDDYLADKKTLAEKLALDGKPLLPARLMELEDSNVTNVRFYQDANRNALWDGETLDQEQAHRNAIERAHGTGRMGAKGPRLSDADVVAAVAGLVKSNPAFQPLQDFINEPCKMTEYPAKIAKLKADFAAAGLTVEQIKAFAKQA